MHDDLVAAGRYARLVTVGRRSGLPRSVIVGFVEDADGALLIAARGGAAWAENLLHDRRCHVTVGDRSWSAQAEPLDDPDFGRAVREHILKYGTPAEELGHGYAFRLRAVAGGDPEAGSEERAP